jgi:hypothetical protein
VLVDDDWLDRHPGVPDAPILATVHWGAGPPGGVLRLVLSDHTPIGPPTAPLVVELLGAIGRSWPVGLPPLEAATPVR